MDWTPSGRMSCLVGPGDATKTTILDAIEFALSPRWSNQFADVDFHNAAPENPIEIHVTVGDAPQALLTEDKFGLHRRGWHIQSGLIDEPDEDGEPCETVITVALSVDAGLDPEWNVVTERNPEGKPIGWRDRARLGMVRLGSEVDREFSWNRLSNLTRMTGDSTETETIIAKAHRALRDAIKSQSMDELLQAAKSVEKAARRLGFSPSREFGPRLESRLVGLGIGSLSLHDGEIPLALAGLGSRRLVALAIQRAAVPEGAIVLIDEVEHGLEPHRIRRLMRSLIRGLRPAEDEAPLEDPTLGQVIMTTHSPTPILELEAAKLNVVKVTSAGETSVSDVPGDLQGTLKFAPYALLGRRVVMCEGETEVGLCWGLEVDWQARNGDESLACRGVVVANGGGRTNAPARAKALRELGYDVALLVDSDEPIVPDEADLRAAGVLVVTWADAVSIEERIAMDLTLSALETLLRTVADQRSEMHVADSIAAEGSPRPSGDIGTWLTSAGGRESDLRRAFGKAAKKKGWFKTVDGGRLLASVVSQEASLAAESDTAQKLAVLERWCYER